MNQTDYTMRVLSPEEGYLLTERADVALGDRTFSPKVYLAAGDTPENWREIPIFEAEKMQAELRAQRTAELEEQKRALGQIEPTEESLEEQRP